MERNSFIFYKGWREAIKDLPDDVRLEIYESIIEYATTGNLRGLKPMANIAFNFIKIDIDRDTEKYMSIVERNKSNGTKGGRPKSDNPEKPKEPIKPSGLSGNPKEPKKADNDNVYDNEYVGDNDPNPKKKEISPNGEPKKDELSLSLLSEKVDYNGLMEYYNCTFKDKLQQIKSMTDIRKKAVKARIAQYGKESIRTAFNLILQSPFLLGANDRNWKCDFDWIFKQVNYTKILEGNYNGKRIDTVSARRESVSHLKDLAGNILRNSPSKED